MERPHWLWLLRSARFLAWLVGLASILWLMLCLPSVVTTCQCLACKQCLLNCSWVEGGSRLKGTHLTKAKVLNLDVTLSIFRLDALRQGLEMEHSLSPPLGILRLPHWGLHPHPPSSSLRPDSVCTATPPNPTEQLPMPLSPQTQAPLERRAEREGGHPFAGGRGPIVWALPDETGPFLHPTDLSGVLTFQYSCHVEDAVSPQFLRVG